MPPKPKPVQPSKKTIEKKKEKIIEVSASVLKAVGCMLSIELLFCVF
jgi:hypothetical protein